MPNGPGTYVTYDRWDEAHKGLVLRVLVLERHSEELRGAEAEHRQLEDRLAVLEQAGRSADASERGRRDRIWVLGLAILTSLVLPLLTTAVIGFIHLRTH